VREVCLDGEREADPRLWLSEHLRADTPRVDSGQGLRRFAEAEEEIGLVNLWMGYGSSTELPRINTTRKWYPSTDSLISVTGGVLPGHGTECDGNCRCHLEKLENGQWVWM
jgi:hypothetical protein